MARPSGSRALSVWMNGEKVGRWIMPSNGPQQLHYDDEWLASDNARPLSLSMPLGPFGTQYQGAVVERFFDNLLPDSRAIRERLRQHFSAQSTRAFDLLTEIGRDCIGAVQLLPVDESPPDVRSIKGEPLTPAAIERLLQGLLSPTPIGRHEEIQDFRISLAGAQEKTALLRSGRKWMRPLGATPTTHIVKLPIGEAHQGIDLSTSVENEWLSARILRAYSVPVAECWVERFGEQQTLIVERFDRRLSTDRTWIARLPQEDGCQATGTAREQKYEVDGGPGIRTIMDLLLGSSQAQQDRFDFLRTQVLFWMLCAIDGHAKNFGLFLEAGGRFRLAPRYDVISAFPVLGTRSRQLSPRKVKMAMAVESGSRHYKWGSIQRRHWEEMARRCGAASFWPRLVDELIEKTPAVVDSVASELPSDFPAHVAGAIFDGLRKSALKLTA
jgi:serine/threonine-protein kinase HipA